MILLSEIQVRGLSWVEFTRMNSNTKVKDGLKWLTMVKRSTVVVIEPMD